MPFLGSRPPLFMHGGLGLRSAFRAAHAAHWASWPTIYLLMTKNKFHNFPESAVRFRGVVESRVVLTSVGPWLMVSVLAHRALRSLTLARSSTIYSSSRQWKNVSTVVPTQRLGFRSRWCLFRPRSVSAPTCSSVVGGFFLSPRNCLYCRLLYGHRWVPVGCTSKGHF